MAKRAIVSRFPVTISTDISEKALHQAMTSASVKTSVDEQDVLFEVVLSKLLLMLSMLTGLSSLSEDKGFNQWKYQMSHGGSSVFVPFKIFP